MLNVRVAAFFDAVSNEIPWKVLFDAVGDSSRWHSPDEDSVSGKAKRLAEVLGPTDAEIAALRSEDTREIVEKNAKLEAELKELRALFRSEFKSRDEKRWAQEHLYKLLELRGLPVPAEDTDGTST